MLLANIENVPATLVRCGWYRPSGVGANEYMQEVFNLVCIHTLRFDHDCLASDKRLGYLLVHFILRSQTFVSEQDRAVLKVRVEPPGEMFRICHGPVVRPEQVTKVINRNSLANTLWSNQNDADLAALI